MSRGFVPTLFFVLSAVLFFGLGSLFASRQSAATEEDQIASLRAEVGLLKRQQTAEAAVATAGHLTDRQPAAAIDDQSRAALVNDIKKQLSISR